MEGRIASPGRFVRVCRAVSKNIRTRPQRRGFSRSAPAARFNVRSERRAGEPGAVRPFFRRGFFEERYRSGQTEQTVNLLAHAFGGSNPPLSTTRKRSGGAAERAAKPKAERSSERRPSGRAAERAAKPKAERSSAGRESAPRCQKETRETEPTALRPADENHSEGNFPGGNSSVG